MNVKNALHVTCLANTLGRLNIFTNGLASIVVLSKIINSCLLTLPLFQNISTLTPGHPINYIRLIPLELIPTNRTDTPLEKAREAHLIDKAETLEPQGKTDVISYTYPTPLPPSAWVSPKRFAGEWSLPVIIWTILPVPVYSPVHIYLSKGNVEKAMRQYALSYKAICQWCQTIFLILETRRN